MSHGLQIGKLARDTGLSVDAIRFYEKEGLLPEPPRSQGGFRLYAARDVEHLRFIRCAQELGFSLAEVRELLLIQDRNTQACAQVRDLICQKLASVRQKMSDLRRLERSLKMALGECEQVLERDDADTHEGCPVLDKFAATGQDGKNHP
jgi:MerR family transcriptional regulator, mercuric resistance operon regulatory protein